MDKIELLETLYNRVDTLNKQLATIKPELEQAKQRYMIALSEYSAVKRMYDDIFNSCQELDMLKCQLKKQVEHLPCQLAKHRKKQAKKQGKANNKAKDKLIALLIKELQERGLK